jgi:hypothetical protein
MYERSATKISEIKASQMVYMSRSRETADVILDAVNCARKRTPEESSDLVRAVPVFLKRV